jgi:hypothetical protein
MIQYGLTQQRGWRSCGAGEGENAKKKGKIKKGRRKKVK